MNPTFILNPQAGGGKAHSQWMQLQPQVKSYFPNHKCLLTRTPEEARTLAFEQSRKAEPIIAAGGDGTIHEVINGAMAAKTTCSNDKIMPLVGILPLGTGRDFARSLKVAQDPAKALWQLSSGKKTLIDVGKIECIDRNGKTKNEYFINEASFGLGGLACIYANQSRAKQILGKLVYSWGLCKAIFNFKPQTIRVYSQEKKLVYSGSIKHIHISNGRFGGGGIPLAPHANLKDGALDFLIVPDMPWLKLIINLPKLYMGKDLSSQGACRFQAKEAIFEMLEGSFPLEGDGENLGYAGTKVACLAKAMEIISPYED